MVVNLKSYKTYKMKPCNITITSNNFNSIQFFFLFLKKNKKKNFHTIKKYFQKKKRKKTLTILKSPHVNKTAQEQFEYRIYSKQLAIYSSQNFQYLVFLKKISAHLFPDIKIKTKFKIDPNMKKQIEVCNPNNFKIDLFRSKTPRNPKRRTKNFIKTFDIYGEFIGINSNKFG